MLLKRVNNLCAQDKKRKENVPSGVPYRPDDKPWYDSEIRRVSRKRDRLKRKFNKTCIQSVNKI